jgi:GTPase SAR1 family protein/predicted transcriptional regulator
MVKGVNGSINEQEKKKIVLVGPSACGKTTFKRIFFEDANPIQLVKESLDPTRGVETDTYAAFSKLISVWDLAGQEIDHWLSDRTDVFNGSNVIVCMLNAAEPLKDSVAFLLKFLKVRNTVSPSTPVFILLTKCDLVSNVESYNMVLKIEKYMQEKHPEFVDACTRTKIHRVSITDVFFLKTMTIAFQIIEACIEKNQLQVSPEHLAEIKSKMKILALFPPSSWLRITDIQIPARLDSSTLQKYIEDLYALGYLARERDEFYSISEKGGHFLSACKKQAVLVKTKAMMENISFFLSLKSEMEKIGNSV